MSKEEMMVCPYNTAHMILKWRMATHLVKCRQQHPVERYETCPFNSTHDVPAPEFQYHVETCPDRRQLHKIMYRTDEEEEMDESCININLPSTSEDWDQDYNCSGSYLNVKEQELEKQMVFRQPVGMSKREKKNFHYNEVQKFGESTGKGYNFGSLK